MKPVLLRIGDACEHVGQPGQRIDVVELAVAISVAMAAARAAPRSEPAKSNERRPKAKPLSARSAALLVRQILPSTRKPVKRSQRLSM